MLSSHAHINMLKHEVRARGVLDDKILDLLQRVPREDFVDDGHQAMAYADTAVPLPHHQQMLTPFQEAKLLQALSVQERDDVLEIGTGSGYVTVLLAHQAASVESVDIFPDFVERANQHLERLMLSHVICHTADASRGLAHAKTYDAIAITAAVPEIPAWYIEHLADGGRLFAFVGQSPTIEAVLLRKNGEHVESTALFETDVPAMIEDGVKETFIL